MDRPVAIMADRDRDLHFLPRKAFLEPFVGMAASRNQMVLSRPTLRISIAQLTSAIAEAS